MKTERAIEILNPEHRCSDGNVVFQGMFVAGIWVLDNVVRGLQPTHWMLLPEPPTAE